MSIHCQHCHAETQLYLCTNCQIQLANMLSQLPWLIDELDTRIECLDRIGVGTIGRNRRPNELNIIDFDAAEQARKVRATLLKWVETITERHTGRRPPALSTVATQALARWLEHNVDAIAKLDLNHKGRHPLYDDIHHLVGTTEKGGHLHATINRHEHHFAGPCPTITGHDRDGEPIRCDTILYADVDEKTVKCPECKQKIDVEDNQRKTAADRDLLTKEQITEALANIDEAIPETRIDQWIKARRLRHRGWIHNGEVVQSQIRSADPAVYSLARARKLRRRDEQLMRLRHTLAAQR